MTPEFSDQPARPVRGGDDATRPTLSDDLQESFWRRPAPGTPGDEPTLVLEAEPTQPMAAQPGPTAADTAPDSGQQPTAQPVTAPVTPPTSAPTRSSRGHGLLRGAALVGIGALSSAVVLAGPQAVRQLEGLRAASSSSQANPQVQEAPTYPTTSGQGRELPAEQQPLDPWQQSSGGQSSGGQSSGQQTSQSSQQEAATAAQSVGVVLIATTTPSGTAAGSGMVLTADGRVLTNYHVVQGSTRVQVQVASTRKTYAATVVGHDASADVAVLQLESARGLATVKIDHDAVSAGGPVTAVGNSLGQGSLSAATGEITSLNSSITVSNDSASGEENLVDVLQTTAGAVPGDSGGPMFDAQGEVLGMTTAGQQTSSRRGGQAVTVASYAVPIQRALAITDQITTGKESGSVRVGANAYLGISVQPLDDGSLQVASVVAGGPAASAGLVAGGVITSLDGRAVASQAALAEALAGHEPGDRVTLGWSDGSGAPNIVEVVLGSSPLN